MNEPKYNVTTGLYFPSAEQFGVTEDFIRRAVYIYQCEGLIG